jgi:hypothetical protein
MRSSGDAAYRGADSTISDVFALDLAGPAFAQRKHTDVISACA